MAVAGVVPSLLCIRLNIMDWFPIVAGTFKVLALGTGMFFAIKWHYDQGKKAKEMNQRAVLGAAGKLAAVFVLSLLCLGLFAFFLIRKLGMDLTFP
jgi:hypothetical protein